MVAPAAEKSLASENGGGDLDSHEQSILEEQLETKPSTATYFSIYRYATPLDTVFIIGSILACSTGGLGAPLTMLVLGSITEDFSDFIQGSDSREEFVSAVDSKDLYLVYIGVTQLVVVTIGIFGLNYCGERITKKLKQAYLRAILRQNVAFFDTTGGGEVAVRITNDMSIIQDGISQKVGLIFFGLAGFLSAIVVSLVKDWRLGLVLLCVPIIILLSMGFMGASLKRFQEKSNLEYANTGNFAEEVISSIKNAVAYGSQARFHKQYEKLLASPEKADLKAKFTMGLLMATITATINLGYGLAFWQSHRFMEQGYTTVGDLIAVLFTTAMAGIIFGNSAPFIAAVAQAGAAASRIFATIERFSPIDALDKFGETLEDVSGAIEFTGVKMAYPSRPNQVILDGFDLSIPASKTVAIVGPSGSGKTTLLALLERFYSPLQGEIKLDGRPINKLNIQWLRSQIGFVSQDNFLFDTSVFENIAYGLGSDYNKLSTEETSKRVYEAAKLANAHMFIESLASGYQTKVGERGSRLSGGQRQRVAIARAIVSNPKILLLDEATSALDTESERLVQDALFTASEGRTTIIVAHRLSAIQRADVIVVMEHGRVTEQGTHDQLMASHSTYASLVASQQLHRGGEPDKYTAKTAEHNNSATRQKTNRVDSKIRGELIKKRVKQSSLFDLVRFVWAFNRPERYHIIAGIVVSVIVGASFPVMGIFFGNGVLALTSPVLTNGGNSLNFWCSMFLMLALILFFTYAAQGYLFALAGSRLGSRARSRAFASILHQDMEFFDRTGNSSGDLTAFLATEATRLTGISGNTMGAVLNSVMNLVSGIAISCSFGWKLGLVATSTLPILVSCAFFRFWITTQIERRFKRDTFAAAKASEAVSAIRTIAALTMEETVLRQYGESLRVEHKGNLSFGFASALIYGLSQSLSILVNALLFWYGGTQLIATGEYTVQQYFVCFLSITISATGAGSIFSYAPEIAGAREAAASLKYLIESTPLIEKADLTVDKNSQRLGGDIELRQIGFAYPSRRQQPVLKDVSLVAKRGQFIALVGGSGSGKSTAVGLLERFYDPSSGMVTIDGTNLCELHLPSFRQEVSLVEQESALIGDTIRECLLSDDSTVGDSAIEDACRSANIYDFVASLPEGLNTLVGARGNRVSGGQKQRLAIAKALLRDPELLLLDEATSALDSESEKLVQQALQSATHGRTTVAVAHRLSSIAHADCIFVFEHGQVLESGTHDELVRRKGRYFELVSLQHLAS